MNCRRAFARGSLYRKDREDLNYGLSELHRYVGSF